MDINLNSYKRDLGMRWIEAESGTTYLCPANAIAGIDNPTEDQLRSLCVDESMNPHNQ